MSFLLFRQISERVMSEGNIRFDPATYVAYEDHQVLQDLLNFRPLLLLHVLAVDGVQRVPDRAGGAALVLRLLTFHVQHVFARPDAQRVAQDINHGELIERSGGGAVDWVNNRRSFQPEGRVLERLQPALAGLVQPAGILKFSEHRGPPFPVGRDRLRSAVKPVAGELAIGSLVEHLPALGQALLAPPISAPLRRARRRPIQPDNLARLRGGHLFHVPYRGVGENSDPYFAVLSVANL